MKDYTSYQARVRDCFAKAYKFIDKHKHPRSREDVNSIIDDMSRTGGVTPDPLLKDLLLACFSELEWEYISGGENKP